VLNTVAYGMALAAHGNYARGVAEGLARRVWGLALVADDLPRWDEAAEHLAAALQAFELGEAFLEVARTHVAWGRICHERGDSAAALDHFEKAAAQFEASGLMEELERARRLTELIKEVK
jgi:tetratricopeptide (TPR) repeat protein